MNKEHKPYKRINPPTIAATMDTVSNCKKSLDME